MTTVAELDARVSTLEKIVNVARYMSPRLAVDDWRKAAAASEQFPSGDLNIADRMRQIGVSQDTIVEDKFPSLAARLTAIEAAIANLSPGGTSGVTELRVRQIVADAIATLPQSGGGSMSDALPPSFQWPTADNGYVAPPNSGGPNGKPADPRVRRGGFVCVSNVAPEGTSATSGPNGQAMGIGGRSRGKIRVNTVRGADGDGGSRNITNYIELAERAGVGTVSRRGWDIFCSEPDALSINTAIWTYDANGVRDGGVFLLRRIDATHFIGNWSDPALDYENRAYVITGADQPDRDRFSVKDGADSNGGYGWRVDKPRNSTEAHATYDPNDPDAGFTDKGDFLLRLFHDNGSNDIGRYSRYKTFNEGRGIAFALSDGTYAECKDVLVMQPGRNGQPGHVDIGIEGYGLRVLETYDLPDGRKGVCFSPGRVPVVRD